MQQKQICVTAFDVDSLHQGHSVCGPPESLAKTCTSLII